MLAIELTANFQSNLAEIHEFLQQADAISAYVALLDELEQALIPNLARFPTMGRPFLQRQQCSPELGQQLQTLQARLQTLGFGTELREYLMGDYLVLYTFNASTGYLLSIRHHRQLSFDFHELWTRQT